LQPLFCATITFPSAPKCIFFRHTEQIFCSLEHPSQIHDILVVIFLLQRIHVLLSDLRANLEQGMQNIISHFIMEVIHDLFSFYSQKEKRERANSITSIYRKADTGRKAKRGTRGRKKN
jgi:hypothetical protein